MTKYVALLRGINVGGKNVIEMAALRRCFEDAGLADVRTYIQSGNVLFSHPDAPARAALVRRLEAMLGAAFDYRATVVLRTQRQLHHVVTRAPKDFGSDPARFRCDVIFLKEPLGAKEALESVSVKKGVDEVHAGRGVLYFSRLVAKASQSELNRLSAMPVYRRMTIRNWNTTTKLAELMRPH